MLIRFTLENWMSFRERVTFSMIASRERQHRDRVPRIKKYQTGILPITAIYGGNASGKTNLFRALDFIQEFVVEGTKPDNLIRVEPFRLDSESLKKPIYFSLELLINEIIYEFSFSVTRKEVIEEKLVKITGENEKILFHRKNNKPHFDKSLEADQRLQFVFEGTRDNQLFLTNSVSQKIKDFKPIYDWFKNTLELIAPDSKFGPIEQVIDEKTLLYEKMNKLLPQLDTGIAHFGSDELPLPLEGMTLDEDARSKIKEAMSDNNARLIISSPKGERFVIGMKSGELVAKKLITYHTKADGSEVKFELQHESDGTKRVIDLLPAFLEVADVAMKKFYVIDEIDRSLHIHLIKRLLEMYLENCSTESRSQILFTTHNVMLMDQELFRRDEMWVAERDNNGCSNLISFSEFKDVRYDKDIRKSYLLGRLGGIPRIVI